MGKKKKKEKRDNKPRPMFICKKCHSFWISDYNPFCIHCHEMGEPQNQSAVRMADWREREGVTDDEIRKEETENAKSFGGYCGDTDLSDLWF